MNNFFLLNHNAQRVKICIMKNLFLQSSAEGMGESVGQILFYVLLVVLIIILVRRFRKKK